jgi:hypothetical protein
LNAQREPIGNREEWQVLAKEAAEEKNPEKMMEIIRLLTRLLMSTHVETAK